MGCTSSKYELSPDDLQFLKGHTNYSEKKIKSWYKGFMVRNVASLEDHSIARSRGIVPTAI